jgi:hypothetical protein
MLIACHSTRRFDELFRAALRPVFQQSRGNARRVFGFSSCLEHPDVTLAMVTDVNCSVHPAPSNFSIMNLNRHGADEMGRANVKRRQPVRRRTSRLALRAPVALSGEDRQKCSFSVPASATNLNRHGAAVQLNRELLVGSVVVVRNKLGIQVSARVLVQLAPVRGVPTYAIEFVEMDDQASNFWGITFPSNPN